MEEREELQQQKIEVNYSKLLVRVLFENGY